jgi:hypothetical protein
MYIIVQLGAVMQYIGSHLLLNSEDEDGVCIILAKEKMLTNRDVN